MSQTHKTVGHLLAFFPKVLKYIHRSEPGAGHETEGRLFKGLSLFLIDHLAFSHLSFPSLSLAQGRIQFGSFSLSVTRGQDSGKEGNEFICNLRARSTVSVSLPIQK